MKNAKKVLPSIIEIKILIMSDLVIEGKYPTPKTDAARFFAATLAFYIERIGWNEDRIRWDKKRIFIEEMKHFRKRCPYSDVICENQIRESMRELYIVWMIYKETVELMTKARKEAHERCVEEINRGGNVLDLYPTGYLKQHIPDYLRLIS